MQLLLQLLRYGAAGVATNLAGYCVYLLLTEGLSLGPKTVMTVLYGVGVSLSYWSARRWVFRSNSSVGPTFTRFVVAHALGYALNFALLFVLSDRLGLPHYWVQAAAIFVVAGLLFVLMRSFVFPDRATSPT